MRVARWLKRLLRRRPRFHVHVEQGAIPVTDVRVFVVSPDCFTFYVESSAKYYDVDLSTTFGPGDAQSMTLLLCPNERTLESRGGPYTIVEFPLPPGRHWQVQANYNARYSAHGVAWCEEDAELALELSEDDLDG